MTDNVELLKECDAGVKMGIESIGKVKSKASAQNFVKMLDHYENEHQKMGNIIHTKLNESGASQKDPNPLGKTASNVSTEMKLIFDGSDKKIADLMFEGCSMGIKSVSRYMNQYSKANKDTMNIANDVIVLEQNFMNELRQYL